jgi:Fe2+ or Zn2+ uptake regulation protein
VTYQSSYHQTQTGLSDEQVASFTAQAARQEEAILAYFKTNPGEYSPETIQEKVLPQAPITSVRRAMTNLTEAGLLKKTGRKEAGRYGRPVGTWALASDQYELFS